MKENIKKSKVKLILNFLDSIVFYRSYHNMIHNKIKRTKIQKVIGLQLTKFS